MKTKSYLFAAASATLMLASCTQNEVVEMPATRAIGFGTYVGNTSRAAATDTDLDYLQGATGNGFYVFGSYMDGTTEIKVFDGKTSGSHVTYTGTADNPAWGYSPINYWSVGKKYQFAAYGPAAALDKGTAAFNYAANTLTFTGFTADGSLDFVVAEGNNAGYTLANATAPTITVGFKFFHALSKVRFTLKNGWRNDVTVKITNVSVKNVNSVGTLETNGHLNTADYAWQALKDKWTNIATPTEYTNWKDDEFKATKYLEQQVYEYFLIPQSIGTDMQLVLTCQVNTGDGTGPDLGNGAGNPKEVTVTLPSDVVAAWEPGKAYNYTLTIDGELFGLKPIQFDAVEVVDWKEPSTDENNPDNPAQEDNLTE